ncbi:MAG: hypothetical protein ACJ76L_14420 [Conexibacter sp.]
MRRHKLILAGLVAIMLATTISKASASRLSVDEQGFRVTWSALAYGSAEVSAVSCPLTLEGSLSGATIAKRAGSTVGRVTRAVIRGGSGAGECTGGTARVNSETLPWDLTYDSFGGTLPNITSVGLSMSRAAFEIDSSQFLIPKCKIQAELVHPWRNSATVAEEVGSTSHFEQLRSDESARITCRDPFEYMTEGAFSGAGVMTKLASASQVAVTLIPAARLSPSPVEFGSTEPETTVRRTITIEAVSAETTVSSISIVRGTNFSITDPNGCRGSRIIANGRCSFTAIFDAPNTLGRTYEDTVTVATNLGTANDVLRGRTRDAIPPVTTPSPIVFGRVAAGGLARRAVTLTARDEVTINSIAMRTGTNFAIIDPHRCIGARLAPAGTCSFNVIVEAPEEAGRAVEDVVLIGNSIRQVEDSVTAET